MHRHKTHRTPLDIRGIAGREDIFRLAVNAKAVGVKKDAAVDRWLSDDLVELRAVARKWFIEMRRCGKDVRELMHDGCPIACIDDAPFGYVNSFKRHVNVGFFYGAMLDDPTGMLEGSGKRMRHVKLKAGAVIDDQSLRDLISAAYADIKARLKADHSS